MDKHKFRKKDVHQRGGKKPALMSLLSKRSTKVEPHPVTDDGSSNSKRTTSANFSPSARSHQSTSSSNNSLTNQAAVVTSHRRTCVHNNNRFSHQFGLCCSVDAKKSASPPIAVRVRYNSMPDGIDQLALDKVAESKLILTNNKAPSAPVSPFESPEHHPTTTTRTVELQTHSIAMSACRSRLRLKLLPPALSTDIPEQHLSSPNVSSSVAIAAAAKEAKGAGVRSFSYDTINHVQHPANPSTDSLAKQSLMAAQVLNLIPTEKARERSFLAGRLAITSLLGGVELDRVLPLREIKIFVGTWNMNGQNPPKQMNDFVFPTGVDHVPDLVAIGTQESCSERFEWEVTLQETLGPTHILLHSANLGTLHLAIFIRRDLIWFCSVPEEDSLSVRPGTAFRTKGAVAISFALFGTSMLFVTSHLTAHQQKVKERVSDVKRIIHALDLPRNLSLRNKNKDVTQNFDSVYWCGDLNFRLAEPREKLLKWIETTRFPLPPHLPHGYMHTDQLSSVLSDGAAFKGFKEANIRFPPTYKYDPGTQQFDTSSKQRAPAYTDRILFKNKSAATGLRRASGLGSGMFATAVECLAYDSVPSIVTSDHKPVWALFRNAIRPGSDSIPLAAGLFNRDVYLEGMKRRLNNTNAGSSAVCAIQ